MKMMTAIKNMDSLQKLTIGSLCSNVILATGLVAAIFAITNEHERIVLVPPHLDRQVEIAWASADSEYMKSFGLYVATLVGNIQPRTSKVVLDTVGVFMDPDIYSEFRRQTRAIIDDPIFKQSGAVITFQPSSIQFEAETSRVFVTGALITKSATNNRAKTVTYEIGLQIRHGRPWVHHFTSYEGSVPHTLAWHVQRAEREGKELPNYVKPGFKPDVPNQFVRPAPPAPDEQPQVLTEETTPAMVQGAADEQSAQPPDTQMQAPNVGAPTSNGAPAQ